MVFSSSKIRYLLILCLLLMALFSFIWLRMPKVFKPDDIASYRELLGILSFEGVVISEADIRQDASYYIVQAKILHFESQTFPIQGKILIKMPFYPEYHYGDLLKISGFLKTPFNESAKGSGFITYSDTLANEGIFTVMYNPEIKLLKKRYYFDGWSLLFLFKQFMAERVETIFPEPVLGLVNGILFGVRSNLSKIIMDHFTTTGLTHILAISGYNITLLIQCIEFLLRSCSKRIRFYSTVVVLGVFALLTGFSASVLRASVMGVLSLTAQFLGRKVLALQALLWAAFIMSLFHPTILIADISFQLSFLATFGILFCLPTIQSKLKNLPSFMAEGLAVTLAAQVLTLPITLMNFGTLSLIAPFANILFLPLIPFIMFFSFFALVVSFFFWPLAIFFSAITWLLCWILLKGVELFSLIPFASIKIERFTFIFLSVYYLGMFFIFRTPKSGPRYFSDRPEV